MFETLFLVASMLCGVGENSSNLQVSEFTQIVSEQALKIILLVEIAVRN